MYLRSLTAAERRAVYDDHVVRDFVPTAPKNFDALERLRAQGVCRVLGAFDESHTLAGYAYIQHPADCAIELLDFFAVLPNRRSEGIGSRFLTLLGEKERFGPTLVAEIEDPDAAEGDEAAQRTRRLDFYRRGGWHDTGLRVRVGKHRCRILSPSETVNESLLRSSLAALYAAVLGDWAKENAVIE